MAEKARSSVCLYPWCQSTAHAILYVTLLVSFLSNTLSTTLAFGPQIPQHFTLSACKPSKTAQISWLCAIPVPHFQSVYCCSSSCYHRSCMFYIFVKIQSNCTVHCPIYLRIMQPRLTFVLLGYKLCDNDSACADHNTAFTQMQDEVVCLTLQRGVTSAARHSENITCRGMTNTARHAACCHSLDNILNK
jgi:hypothetical protein